MGRVVWAIGGTAESMAGNEHGSWRGPVIVGAVVLMVAAFGLTVGRSEGGLSPTWAVPAAPEAPFIGARSGPVLAQLSAVGVDTVEIDGIAGQVTITAESSSVIGDAGSTAPLLYQLDSATHTLHLFCAGSGNCPSAVYIVTIPEHVGLTLHQISGQSTLTGLSGPVDITTSSTGMSAVGLDTDSFTASITSGQLTATFASAPREVAVTVVSAQATMHLPGGDQYAVSQHVTSGNVGIGVPQNPNASDTVDATVVSGQISLVDE